MRSLIRYISLALLIALPTATFAQPAGELEGLIDEAAEGGIDREVARELATRARERGLDVTETRSLLEPAVELGREGYPGTPVAQKALEGLAKGVPAARIHPVVRELSGHTREIGGFVQEWAARPEVRSMLGGEDSERPNGGEGSGSEAGRSGGSTELVIESAAQARMQGAPRAEIQEFLSGLPAQTSRRPIGPAEIANAVQVIPDVPGGNGPPNGVGRLLTAALDAGLSPESIRQIPAALEEANRLTGRPVDALARSAASEMTSGTPAGQVVQNLFAGGRPGSAPPAGAPGPPEGTPPGNDGPSGGPPGDGPGRAGGEDPGSPDSGPPGDGSNGPPNQAPGGGSP